MSTVIQFVPKARVTARINLTAFIALCRDELTAFGEDLQFQLPSWNVTKHLVQKGSKCVQRLNFSAWDTARSKSFVPMTEPFASFAKAYVRYAQAWKPRASYSPTLTALRALEKALIEHTSSSCPTGTNPEVMREASRLTEENLSPATAYNVGVELETILSFAIKHRLLAKPFEWRNLTRPKFHARTRVGREFDEQRQRKMPSPRAFEALGHIFHIARDTSDILVSSVSAILCSAPCRIAEVVNLPRDCEVQREDPRTGKNTLALRWWPAKGAPPGLKAIATPMKDVVSDALRKLRELSSSARSIAKWYEAHPTKLYLPRNLQHLRKRDSLSMPELCAVLFEDDGKYYPSRPRQWCLSNGVATFKVHGKSYAKFTDVEQAVLRLLPPGFPIVDRDSGLKYSEALVLLPRAALDASKPNYRCMFSPVEDMDIASRLGRRAEVSIFEKHGFREDDGSPIRLTTHTFRHYLNTLAQLGNLGQLDIAKWSGRANVSQNAVYNHVSDREAVETLRLAIAGEAPAVGPVARLHRVALIPRDQFARLKVPTAHTTEYGYCVHDFTMLPC